MKRYAFLFSALTLTAVVSSATVLSSSKESGIPSSSPETPSSAAPSAWQLQGNRIHTPWAEQVNPASVLPEYPRPIMERSEWKNLNGLWDYAIRPVGSPSPFGVAPSPAMKDSESASDGQILVPFCIESSLSGVQKKVGRANELWYRTRFTVPTRWKGQRTLLHFGAVDWRCEVFVNGIKIGSHQGGYTAFTFDITPYLYAKGRVLGGAEASGEQELVVRVWDPTDEGFGGIGKQRNRPDGIWYTSVTGIWQTVWLEPVAQQHFTQVVPTADIDGRRLLIDAQTEGTDAGDFVRVTLLAGNTVVATGAAAVGQAVELSVNTPHLWSPDDPFLYDLQLQLQHAGKTVDTVKSYAAMRKISLGRDRNGITRLMLNNQPLFQLGPLDQGYWPDGLYTAPTDEALRYDIQKTKDFGFNMIRKHMKVESDRWFTHCDRLGILVWQDQPMSDNGPGWDSRNYWRGSDEGRRSPESEQNFRNEWQEIINQFRSYPCVAVWTPFNEAWGQFKTKEIAEWTKQLDPTRLVNPASGGNHFQTGDILDLHNYPNPEMYLFDAARATVLGEFGGLGLALEGHLWQPDRNWGYVQFKTTDEVTARYVENMRALQPFIQRGFAAAVYTQTTDVEIEVNGLMTYDRRVVKIKEDDMRRVNQETINSLR